MSTGEEEEEEEEKEELPDSQIMDEVQEEKEEVKNYIYLSLHHVFEGIWMVPTSSPHLSVWGINNNNFKKVKDFKKNMKST